MALKGLLLSSQIQWYFITRLTLWENVATSSLGVIHSLLK